MHKSYRLRKSGISGVAVVFFIALVIIVLASVGIYMYLTSPSSTSSTTQSLTSTTPQQLYGLIFMQSGVCSPPIYSSGWSVVLNNSTTEIQPPNATLPAIAAGPEFKVYQNITFTVTQGNYSYSAGGSNYLSQIGNASVINSNATITVTDTATCTTVISSSSSNP